MPIFVAQFGQSRKRKSRQIHDRLKTQKHEPIKIIKNIS